MRMHHFWVQDGPFAPNKNFLGKNNIIFIYLLVHCTLYKSLKKFLGQIQSYVDAPVLGQNGHLPK